MRSLQRVAGGDREDPRARVDLVLCHAQAVPDDSPRRHQDLVETILDGEHARIADAVREHLVVGRQRTLEVLEPYFRMRKAAGRRFSRSDKNLKQPRTHSDVH